jgi:hypothetical protein
MNRWSIVVTSAALALLATTSPSFAQTAADAAKRWGLLGTWKPDCAAPSARTNNQYDYVVRDGALFLDRDVGDAKDSVPIPQAVINGDGTLEMVVVFASASSTRKNVMARGSDGRIRVITNYDVKTLEHSVTDGKLLHNGAEVPWQTRCR